MFSKPLHHARIVSRLANSFIFICMGVWPRCICMYMQCPRKPVRDNRSTGNGSSRAGITDGRDYHVFWKLNPGFGKQAALIIQVSVSILFLKICKQNE